MIQACNLRKEDIILEIGPGLGILTETMAPQVAGLYAIEKDKDLYRKLNEHFNSPRIHILHEDFLKFDVTKIPGLTKIIGNLPYNISTPIIEKLIHEIHAQQTCFFTVQWEFGKRLTSQKSGKDYGALTCFVQYHCDLQILFKIKNTSFWPAPKVASCFMKMQLKRKKLCADDEQLLFKIIRQAFQQRRKKIINALGDIIDKDKLSHILSTIKIKPDFRAENLALEDFIKISNAL